MPEAPRNKGQFWQAAFWTAIPKINGSLLSVDGFVDFDTVYEQADYPALFAAIGTNYNTGGESGSQFRTPKRSDWIESGVKQKTFSIAFDDPTSISLGNFPSGHILRVNSSVKTVWDGVSPSIEIGSSGTSDLIVATNTIDLESVKTDSVATVVELSGETELFATMVHGSGVTQGELMVMLEYTGDLDLSVPVIRF